MLTQDSGGQRRKGSNEICFADLGRGEAISISLQCLDGSEMRYRRSERGSIKDVGGGKEVWWGKKKDAGKIELPPKQTEAPAV